MGENLPRVIYSLEEKNIKRNNILRWDLSLEHQGLICSLHQSIMNRTTLLTTASLEHREVKKIMLSSTGLETENPSCDLSSIFRAKSKLKLCRPRYFFFSRSHGHCSNITTVRIASRQSIEAYQLVFVLVSCRA